MANKAIYDGTPGPISGSTPFGFYDLDPAYQIDGPKVANFCARKLGYPIMDVELDDINLYTCFEQAVTTYGNELYTFKIRDNYLSLEGSNTGSSLNNTVVIPSLNSQITLAEAYGSEVGAGGYQTWYSGSLKLKPHEQHYDMNEWAQASASLAPGDSIIIRRLFYEQPPAIVRYFDPYLGSGFNYQGMMESFGWGSYSPAVSYMMFPLYWDIERVQAIEMSDYVRRNQYSFELVNNKLTIFPNPGDSEGYFAFQYTKRSDAANPAQGPYSGSTNLVTNVSNVPYGNPIYTQINASGRYWIFEYTSALAKEMLGLIRGKYTTVPIPGAEATLNQNDLLTDARAEKAALLEKLRQDLDETTRQKQLERKQAENVAMKATFDNLPLQIYIG
jgi:hypothetical protein